MSDQNSSEFTQLLAAASDGDQAAAQRLTPLVYEQLRALAASYLRQEPTAHTLQPTALVNEAYLKLVDQSRVDWRRRTHFVAISAKIMRRILVDHARRKRREKRGGGRMRIPLDDNLRLSPDKHGDVLAVDEALAKLAELDERQAKIVELRFFAGMTVQEVADFLGISKRTVEADWTMVRAWLRRELTDAAE